MANADENVVPNDNDLIYMVHPDVKADTNSTDEPSQMTYAGWRDSWRHLGWELVPRDEVVAGETAAEDADAAAAQAALVAPPVEDDETVAPARGRGGR